MYAVRFCHAMEGRTPAEFVPHPFCVFVSLLACFFVKWAPLYSSRREMRCRFFSGDRTRSTAVDRCCGRRVTANHWFAAVRSPLSALQVARRLFADHAGGGSCGRCTRRRSGCVGHLAAMKHRRFRLAVPAKPIAPIVHRTRRSTELAAARTPSFFPGSLWRAPVVPSLGPALHFSFLYPRALSPVFF